jgi:hypothetical protein
VAASNFPTALQYSNIVQLQAIESQAQSTMGFFSDPAAKEVPADLFQPVSPGAGAGAGAGASRRPVEERKLRRELRDGQRRGSETVIPAVETPTTANCGSKNGRTMRRSSSLLSIKDVVTGRRGSRRGSANFNWMADSSRSNTSLNTSDSSMHDHLAELETFVLHVKHNVDKKQQKKILRRASHCNLEHIHFS